MDTTNNPMDTPTSATSPPGAAAQPPTHAANRPSRSATPPSSEASQDGLIERVTLAYLNALDLNNLPHYNEIKDDLLTVTRDQIAIYNAGTSKDGKWPLPKSLSPYQVALIIAKTEPVICVNCTGDESNRAMDILAAYEDNSDSKSYGLYKTDEEEIEEMIQKFNLEFKHNDIKEVILRLRRIVPHLPRCEDKDLIAVNNGVFNYKTKQLLPFSPDMVFLCKSAVNYDPNAKNIIIHNPDDGTDWDVESWMADLSDDPEIVTLLWQILGAIIRPNVPWNKAAWFYSMTGNNGKGTLCHLMRQLCGQGAHTSISLAQFAKDFMLEPLVHASAIITDENDVGGYIDRAADLKSVITGDVIQINRKYKTPLKYRYHGFMIQGTAGDRRYGCEAFSLHTILSVCLL